MMRISLFKAKGGAGNMRQFALILFFLSATLLQAQEVLLPLSYRGELAKDAVAVKLPFFDDFSNYQGAPNPKLWDGQDAYVSQDFAAFPPTLGVVTLDAVDADGVLHNGAGIGIFSADTLMSQPIRLDSLFSPQSMALHPSDSVYLSFYYLPGGGTGVLWKRNGDAPEEKDSLFLEFYNPTTESWDMVWSTGGWDLDAMADSLTRIGLGLGCLWQYVTVPIKNSPYFSKDFRFRFRNYASLDDIPKLGLVGNCDHWNIDYVYLDYHRTKSDRYSRDIAFVDKAPSFLKDYQAMPAKQYRADDMATEVSMTIANRYSQQLSSQYGYTIYRSNGTVVGNYDGGYDNVPPFFPSGAYQASVSHATPPVNVAFPPSSSPETYKIVHMVREGVSGDAHTVNDTTIFLQVFDNYYAYDDGVPENGYGLSSSSSRAKLAYHFKLNNADTLMALDIYFNHTREEENASMFFHLCVWADDGSGHPGTLLYMDQTRRKPYFDGLNKYHRYLLESPVVVSGDIYVGFEQVVSGYINLGFDRGHDARTHSYYLTGTQWQQSILSGALMLRPYFGSRAMVNISDAPIQHQMKTYPNPVSDILQIDLPEGCSSLQLYSISGCKIATYSPANQINLKSLSSGVYMLRAISATQTYQTVIVKE